MSVHRSTEARLVLLAAFVLALPGCALLARTLEEPRIAVTDLRLDSVGLFQQRWVVGLELTNPNAVALPVDALQYALSVGGVRLGEGRIRPEKRIAPNATTPLELVLTTRTDQIGTLAARWLNDPPQTVDYRLDGTLETGLFGRGIPLSREGSIPLVLR